MSDFETRYQKLLSHKEDSNMSRLHFAAIINDPKMGEILISNGEDINGEDINDRNVNYYF